MSEHTAKRNVALLSILSNAFLTIAKLVAGLSIGSVSIISEAIHSGMDLFASFIAFFAVRKSALPPDIDHAFGHGKYEDASGLIEALLIILAAAIIIWEAVNKLIFGGDTLSTDLLFIGMIVMGVSAVMNIFVSQKLMKVAKETDSIALESDAWHLRTDVFTSIGVVIGLILIQITGLTFLDSVVAILVALLILREALSLIKRSFGDLMDESLDEKDVEKIQGIICRHQNTFTNYHSLKTRKAGPNKFIEFHLMMPHATPLSDAHHVLKEIEDELKAEIPRVIVIIHLDPCDGRCERDTCTFSCRRKT